MRKKPQRIPAKKLQQSFATDDVELVGELLSARGSRPARVYEQAHGAVSLTEAGKLADVCWGNVVGVELGLDQNALLSDPCVPVDSTIAGIPLIASDPQSPLAERGENCLLEDKRIYSLRAKVGHLRARA